MNTESSVGQLAPGHAVVRKEFSKNGLEISPFTHAACHFQG